MKKIYYQDIIGCAFLQLEDEGINSLTIDDIDYYATLVFNKLKDDNLNYSYREGKGYLKEFLREQNLYDYHQDYNGIDYLTLKEDITLNEVASKTLGTIPTFLTTYLLDDEIRVKFINYISTDFIEDKKMVYACMFVDKGYIVNLAHLVGESVVYGTNTLLYDVIYAYGSVDNEIKLINSIDLPLDKDKNLGYLYYKDTTKVLKTFDFLEDALKYCDELNVNYLAKNKIENKEINLKYLSDLQNKYFTAINKAKQENYEKIINQESNDIKKAIKALKQV